jgi:5-methylcytosine-specific restriction protein A
MTAHSFERGKIYHRQRDIHEIYGGQERGGIITPKSAPLIILISGETGEEYGYKDGWDEHGIFLYTGEGQVGDMEFVRGNAGVRDHVQNGKDLLLFENVQKGLYRLWATICTSWEYRRRR